MGKGWRPVLPGTKTPSETLDPSSRRKWETPGSPTEGLFRIPVTTPYPRALGPTTEGSWFRVLEDLDAKVGRTVSPSPRGQSHRFFVGT